MRFDDIKGFDNTKGFLQNLAEQSITADMLLDILVSVSKDVRAYNGVESAWDLKVEDQVLLHRRAFTLTEMLLKLYALNRADIDGMNEKRTQRYDDMMTEMEALHKELEGMQEALARAEQQRDALKALRDRTKAERGHLLNVQNECEVLRAEIDTLNDAALDTMAEEKAKLEEALNARRAQARAVAEEKASVNADIAATTERIEKLNSALAVAKSDYSDCLEEEQAQLAEKERLECDTQAVRERLEALRVQIAGIPEENKRINEEYETIKTKMRYIITAIHAVRSEAFLAENLYRRGESKALKVENYPDLGIAAQIIEDLAAFTAWAEALEQRMSGLGEVLTHTLAALVASAESLTEKDGGSNE